MTISLFGATGSIGTNTLDVVRNLNIPLHAVAAKKNAARMEEICREFHPAFAVMEEETAAADLKQRLSDTAVRVLAGEDDLCEVAEHAGVDRIVNAIVGIDGLAPTYAAVSAGIDVALANKESLVAAGTLIMKTAHNTGSRILPVDSEHSAVFQCLQGAPANALKRIVLTASGGPFFGKTREELSAVTPEQALDHPKWNMGTKISVDSATLMNKGLEVIEAAHLFGLPSSRISVLVHREAIVHSMVEFCDHSVLAQLGAADMRIPIQYALTYPERAPSPAPQLSLLDEASLSFRKPDEDTFTCLRSCRSAMEKGGLIPAAVNGANEAAVAAFLAGKISFLKIGELVEAALSMTLPGNENELSDIYAADAAARELVYSAC